MITLRSCASTKRWLNTENCTVRCRTSPRVASPVGEPARVAVVRHDRVVGDEVVDLAAEARRCWVRWPWPWRSPWMAGRLALPRQDPPAIRSSNRAIGWTSCPVIARHVLDILLMLPSGIDALDAKLIQAMCETPRAGVMELARQLGVARGTVQARLDKLQKRGIISGFDPDLDLQAMGYEVLAFVTLEIAQGRLDDVIEHLADDPRGARGARHHRPRRPALPRRRPHQRAPAGACSAGCSRCPGIMRTTTQIALSEQVRHRVLPLVAQVIDEATESAPPRRRRGAR